MFLKNKRQFTLFYLFGAIFLITLPFTNCDTSNSGAGLFNTLTSACQVDSTGYNPCVLQDPSTIQLQVNSGSLIQLPPSTTTSGGFTFDVGGDCNEGGYQASTSSGTLNDSSSNLVHYTFRPAQSNTGIVSQSDGTAITPACSGLDKNGWLSSAQPGDHTGVCVNGRFSIHVFSCVALAQSDFLLMISITATDSTGAPISTVNSVASTRTVTVRGTSP